MNGTREHKPGRDAHREAQSGFTLVELLVVVAIIGILASIAIGAFRGAMERSRQSKSVTVMRELGTALASYSVDTGHMPSASIPISTLGTLLNGGTYRQVHTQDGWNTDLVYTTDGAHYTLTSYGSDKALGPQRITPATRSQFAYDIVLVDGIFVNSPN